MKKLSEYFGSFFLIFLIMFNSLILLTGCNEKENINSTNPQRLYAESEDPDAYLLEDPLVQELFSIRDEFARRILENVTGQSELIELQEAYLNNDTSAILYFMNYSLEELDSIGNRLNEIGSILFSEHHQLTDYAESIELCEPCMDEVFNNFWDIFGNGVPQIDEVTCAWGPFIATLIICGTTGPILYWICAYAAICAWCGGGWVNAACA